MGILRVVNFLVKKTWDFFFWHQQWQPAIGLDQRWFFIGFSVGKNPSTGDQKQRLKVREQRLISFGQIIATSADVTPNGGLVRESFQNPLNSGLGIIVICPDIC